LLHGLAVQSTTGKTPETIVHTTDQEQRVFAVDGEDAGADHDQRAGPYERPQLLDVTHVRTVASQIESRPRRGRLSWYLA
jgi:hypothetical protein